MGSCHGLVAVALGRDRGFHKWNPLTGDYKELPDPCFTSPMDINKFLDNGFVPSREDTIFNGFGYDSSTDDYKLFLGVQKSWQRPAMVDSSFKETIVSIFSVRKNSWRTIQSPPTNPSFFLHQNRSGCFVNGALNRLTGTPRTEEILSFDLKTETFSRLALPNKGDMKYMVMSMGAIDGKLCLAFYDTSLSCPVDLWVMEEYGVEQSWTKLLTINVEKHFVRSLPLCFSEGKQVISINEDKDLSRSGANGSIVERFRICRCRRKNFRSFSKYINHCQAIVYAESLISPNVKYH